MQETYKKYQEIWYQKWNSYRFEVILTICFLIWTPILITETLRIQDSCSPMVVFSNEHLERCHHREVFCEVGFPRSQLVIFGAILIAIIATLLLVPTEANFCFFSSCDRTLPDPSLAHNFWSLAGGFGMGAILTLMGLSAPIAILGSLGIWLLMQMSL